ncbi:MAG: hypothetical protein L6R40_007909 [Gallowayella cf. fulva]|nr:MAG: hypothetical protein L6R40_007909 [Xanthomendoza cf. fulva]
MTEPTDQNQKPFTPADASDQVICGTFELIYTIRRNADQLPMPVSLLLLDIGIDRQLSDVEKSDWHGLQKVFAYMFVQYEKRKTKPLVSNIDEDFSDRLQGIWRQFRLDSKNAVGHVLGCSIWDEDGFFEQDKQWHVYKVLSKVSGLALKGFLGLEDLIISKRSAGNEGDLEEEKP